MMEAVEPLNEEELRTAASQENHEFVLAQNRYLMDRVAHLRVELNRARARLVELENEASEKAAR